jgi:UDP-N-acetylglucosamine 4,6-dehydratase (inverting)
MEKINKNMNFLKNKSILITGGTGSFGQAFVNQVLKHHKIIKKLIIFSRDELKQFDMEQKYSLKKYPKLRYFLGDLRDKERVSRALDGVDIVVHAAALKQVPKAEYDPFEYVKTNVVGAQNLIEACLDKKVKNVIALSTDKAVSPINLYGATKLCSDKLFLSANNIKGANKIRFSVVRYGNVLGSRGSVLPFFLKNLSKGILPVTDINMTRFSMSILDAVNIVMWSIENNKGGEVFIPKIPSYRIMDLVKAISQNIKVKIVGIRPGEKIDEQLITEAESLKTYDLNKYYIILGNDDPALKSFYENKKTKAIPKKFNYSSNNNKDFLTISDLKKSIKKFLIESK